MARSKKTSAAKRVPEIQALAGEVMTHADAVVNLGKQYNRILQVGSLVETVRALIAAMDPDDDGTVETMTRGQLTAMFGTLTVATETLEDIAGQIELAASKQPPMEVNHDCQ